MKFNNLLSKIDVHLLKLLRFGIVLLIIGIPAYPKFPIFSLPGTYVSIRAEDLLIAVIAFVWVIYIRDKWKELWNINVIKAAVLFLVVGAIASLSAIFLTQTGKPLQIILHTMRRWEYLVVLPIILSVVKTRKDVLYYMKVVLLTIIIVLIYGLGQKIFEWPIISTMNKEYSQGIAQAIMKGGRINSTFAGHYDLAAYGVIIMNVLFGILAASKYKTSKIYIIGLIIGVGWILGVSASRISFAAYLGSIFLTMTLLRKWLWIVPVMGISLLVFLKTPSLMDRYAEAFRYEFLPRLANIEWFWHKSTPSDKDIAVVTTITPTPTISKLDQTNTSEPADNSLPSNIVEAKPTKTPKSIAGTQLQYVQPPEDRSTAIRFKKEWPRAIRAWTKNPLLGLGYSSITLATDNDYLRALGEVGLLGFVAFLVLLVSIFVEIVIYLKRKFKTKDGAMVIGYLGAMLGFLANAMFIDVFEASKVAIYFWILTGLFIAFINTDTQKYERLIINKK